MFEKPAPKVRVKGFADPLEAINRSVVKKTNDESINIDTTMHRLDRQFATDREVYKPLDE